jgi:hypothetical protein
MTNASVTAPAVIIPHRSIKLPAIGTHLPHLGGSFGGLHRAKPGSGLADYPLIVMDGPDLVNVSWGSSGQDEPGAQCQWDGKANTAALLDSKYDHPIVKTLTPELVQGPEGIYIPSQREAAMLVANGCEAFDPKRTYWTSTQYSRSNAWCVDFKTGLIGICSKSWAGGAARFVRRSSLEDLIP